MGHFLRDKRVVNLRISEAAIRQVYAVFEDRARTLDATVSEDHPERKAILSCIIRFDNKGYRVFTLNDLLGYFSQGKTIERIIFTLDTGQALGSNRQAGTYMELRLDLDQTTCIHAVSADDRNWVDASFSAVQEALQKFATKNGWVRTSWTAFFVQVAGVAFGFIISLWAAAKLSPRLAIQNAFYLTFLFALLLFSNTWAYLVQLIHKGLNAAFPNVEFYRPDKERWRWLIQAVVGGIVVAAVLYLFGKMAGLVTNIFDSLLKTGA